MAGREASFLSRTGIRSGWASDRPLFAAGRCGERTFQDGAQCAHPTRSLWQGIWQRPSVSGLCLHRKSECRAVRYEIEVTSKYPENLHGFSPSVHRIYAAKTELTDLYDDALRTGTYYWRVRGMDSTGKPVGEWSLPQEIKNPVKHWKVAVYGDSISHGGGHLSFGPADLAYSYESYLDFPSINLSQSGDTSEAMVMRFEKDVLPFSPEYLLIMGGTNSLRAGVPAADVIFDLKEIQRKCREHGITPILMTLPPINPENIQKAFDEPTYEGWKASFDEVNAFIRGEVHIDTAAPFEEMEELPTWLALDGIHGDWNMKRMMAEVINREFPKIMAE